VPLNSGSGSPPPQRRVACVKFGFGYSKDVPQNATSNKPPSVKAQALALYAEGRSKSEIARRLDIDRETVTRILNDPEYTEAIEASRARVLGLLPKAERALEKELDEGNGELGFRLLEKNGVFQPNGSRGAVTDARVQIAINNLLPHPTNGQSPSKSQAHGEPATYISAGGESAAPQEAPANVTGPCAPAPNQRPQDSPEPPAFVIPERFRDLERWKREHDAQWLGRWASPLRDADRGDKKWA